MTKIDNWLSENNFAGFLMHRTDEFGGEYLPAYAERLSWLTGFTGSAGVVVAGVEKSAIFVDGRYTIQVEQQIDKDEYEIAKLSPKSVCEWISQNFKSGDVIGYDNWLITPKQLEFYQKNTDVKWAECENPIDLLWQDQPAKPKGEITEFPVEIAGLSKQQKIKIITDELKSNDLNACVLTMSDSVAWAFNIRGNDVEFNPVKLCYGIIYADGNSSIYEPFNESADELINLTGKVGIDFNFAPIGLIDLIGGEVVDFKDVARNTKQYKTDAEITAMRNCHIRDGVAMVNMLHYIDTTPINKQNEWDNAQQLLKFRLQCENFQQLSFDTISGFGSNGAIVHYRVDNKSSLQFTDNNLYLLDSGSQYTDGTTDITRTVVIGNPSGEQKTNFTLVLKGMINLTLSKMPIGTNGIEFDKIARQPLLDNGLNYAHGTGHGVGCGLNVHEGDISISPLSKCEFKGRIIVSNEPGYYKTGEYGIRIENLMVSHEVGKNIEWETLTLCPIDKRLINKSLLNDNEINWLNQYHKTVWKKLSPLVYGDVKLWLDRVCKNI